MSTFECIVKYGHFGAGHELERAVRVRAHNIVEAMKRAKRLPGVKKGQLGFSGASVTRVSLVH